MGTERVDARYHPRPPKRSLRVGDKAPTRDIEALLSIHHHYCMSARMLCALVGWHYENYGKYRIGILKKNKLVEPRQYIRDRYMCDFLFLTDAGRDYLFKRGLYSEEADRIKANTREEFPHTIMISDFLSLMQIGFRKHGIEYIPEHRTIPLTQTTKLNNPRTIESQRKVVPDRYYTAGYHDGAISNAVEIERGTHRGAQSDKKIYYIQAMFKERAWEKKLNAKGVPFDNLMFQIVGRSEEHMRTLMSKVDLSLPHGGMIFNWITCIDSGKRQEVDDRLMEPWYMADGSRFDIIKGEKIRA